MAIRKEYVISRSIIDIMLRDNLGINLRGMFVILPPFLTMAVILNKGKGALS